MKGAITIITGKATAICLLQILTEYSDENHILQMKDIITKMHALYGIDPDRRTIYSSVELLNDLGYDVSSYEDSKGYYLKERIFEQGEIRLLMDAVYSFPFIPAKHINDLIDKLQKLISVHDRKKYKHLVTARPDLKSQNREVFFNIEELYKAITNKIKVKFDYLQYDVEKKLVVRRNKKYTVNPYGMVFTNEHYYLVCTLAYQSNVSLYRIDKMKEIELTDYSLDKQALDFDPKGCVQQAVFAFTGEPEAITMICQPHILDYIIDKFGTDIHIQSLEGNMLEVQLTASPQRC